MKKRLCALLMLCLFAFSSCDSLPKESTPPDRGAEGYVLLGTRVSKGKSGIAVELGSDPNETAKKEKMQIGLLLTYDGQGRVIRRVDRVRGTDEKTGYGEDGSYAVTSKNKIFRYDAEGRLVYSETTNSFGKTESWERRTYDEAGRLSRSVGYCFGDPSAEWDRGYTYQFSEDGLLLTETCTEDWGSTSIVYSYDENGYLTGKTDHPYRYTYENDGEGRPLAECRYREDDPAPILKTEYTYDAQGRTLTKDVYMRESAGLVFNHGSTYAYDENGRIVKEGVVNTVTGEDRYVYYNVYEYDTLGNLLRSAENGVITEYIYGYLQNEK